MRPCEENEFGHIGETLTLHADEWVPCLNVGDEVGYLDRFGCIESVNRDSREVTIRFSETWFSVFTEGDVWHDMQNFDDMRGNIRQVELRRYRVNSHGMKIELPMPKGDA